jgi:cytochrome c oxidase assembly protein subunit 15
MIHRYAAGTLGIMVLGLTVVAWRRAGQRGRRPWAETGLLALITVQAALGMWTVTLLLKPVIVTLHLLGGMATLALLVWLSSGEFWRQSEANEPPTSSNRRFLPIVWLALGALLGQIALGGWVSSNYAALACSDFPKCQGAWLPVADFEHGFALLRPLGQTLSGEALPVTALTAIHLTHRIGALVVTLIVGALAWRLGRDTRLQALGQALAAALGLQVSLGIANVLLQLPLALAVMHTLGAALLLAVTVVCARRLTRRGNLTPKGY